MSVFHLLKRNKKRAQFARFSALIAAPTVLGTLQMPAGGIVAVSDDAGITAGQIVLTIDARVVETPTVAADFIHIIGYVEAGKIINPATTTGGTMTLYVLDGFGVPFAIGTKT